MIRRGCLAALALFAMSCGSDDDGMPMMMVGDQCTGLSSCGGGQQNFQTVSFCENCFARPDTDVCEAGTCRTLNTPLAGAVTFQFDVPRSAEGALSYTQAIVNRVRADGTVVDCASLLAATDYQDNEAYSTDSSNFRSIVMGAMFGFVYPGRIPAEPGPNKILVVRVTRDTQGKGEVVAQGCTENIEVLDGMDTQVAITVASP